MFVMVLADEETFSELEGCSIVDVPDNVDDIDNYIVEACETGNVVTVFRS